MLEKIKKNIFVSIALGAAIFLILTIYADFNSVINSFRNFPLWLIPVLLALSFLNYFTRFLKWHYYLVLLKVQPKVADSLAIFMSGLIMSVTPGKMGELLKSLLLKRVNNTPISKSAPIVLAERITDFLSLTILAFIGSLVFDYGIWIVLSAGLFFLLLVLLITNRGISFRIIGLLAKLQFLKNHLSRINSAYESSYQMLRAKPLILMLILSVISWFFECFGFYLILIYFNLQVSIFWAIFVYAFATIAGAVTMLPAGLGVTEGSLTYLMIRGGFTKETSVSATFILRVATLWFAVLVGIIWLYFYQNKFGKINNLQFSEGDLNVKIQEDQGSR